MPFKSDKQRKYMYAKHPDIAKKWEKEYNDGGIVSDDEKEKKAKKQGFQLIIGLIDKGSPKKKKEDEYEEELDKKSKLPKK
jgi:hypothetical protein